MLKRIEVVVKVEKFQFNVGMIKKAIAVEEL